jgi:hypothetical protein
MKTYSLNEHTCLLGGIPLEEDIRSISAAPLGPRFTFVSGVDGTTTMSENKGNDNHNLKIKVGYGSKENAVISAIYQAARLSGAGNAGIVPFMLKDRQGTSVLATLECIPIGWPDVERAAESGEVEWSFFLVQPERFEGGL